MRHADVDDKYLYDDFAFATREGLIPKIVRYEDAKKMKTFDHARLIFYRELNTFSEIEFDFTLTGITTKDAEDVVHRRRVEAA